jgi:hypothetical protein|tara:strand:- start:5 stop:454 length:450 start_codon:yes stop_codon:yes gene_type:complete
MRKRYKGKFKIKNPKKYKGNPTNIIYRSLMELRFMKWCDTSEKILTWNSEEVIIPYISPIDNKRHRYFPDFLIQTEKGWTLIEVKPQVQTKPPKKLVLETLTLKKKRRYVNAVQTWLINEAKWKAAEQVCKKKGWRFQIMTEKQLQPDK